MADLNLDLKLSEEDVQPSKQSATEGFDYYSQGSTTQGTDSQYIESPSIFLTNEDVSDIKGRNQGYIDTTANAIGTFGLKTVGTLIEDVGYLVGTVNGLSKVIDPNADTKVADFTDNPIREFGTEMNEWVDKLMPNYESNDEKENPVALRNLLGTVGNTVTRDAAPFMAAAILEAYGLGKIFQAPARLARLKAIAESGGELAKKATQLSKLLQKAPAEVTQLLVNNGEAMLEADHSSTQIYEDVFAKEMAKHGDENIATQLADAAKTEAFKNIYTLNMAILKINNLETRSLFKPSLYSRRPLKELTQEWSKQLTKIDKAKFIAQKGWNYMSDPIKESAEELLQGGASQAVSERLINEGGDSKLSASELFNSGVDTLINGVKRIGTDEGKLEVLTSMILAGPMSAYHKYKGSQDERNDQLKRKGIYDSSIKSEFREIEDLTEDTKDESTNSFKKSLSNKGKELLSTARTYNDFENLKNAALVTDDQTLYGIVRDTQLANTSFGHFEMGLGETLEDKIDSISKEVGKELKANGKTTIEDFSTGKNISVEQYTANIKEKVKRYESVYNTLENRYNLPNPEVRQSAFINAVLQTELKNKIQNPKLVIGESWIDYKSNNINIPDSTIINNLHKELSSLEGKLDSESINKSIGLNKIIQDYSNLQELSNKGTKLDIEDNFKNHKDNKTNKLYYQALKDQFDLLTNPETGKKYLETKVTEDEQKTQDIINPVSNTIISKNIPEDVINNSTNVIPNVEETNNQPVTLPSSLSEQEAFLELGIEEEHDLPEVFTQKGVDIEGSVKKAEKENKIISESKDNNFEINTNDDSELEPTETKDNSIETINKEIDSKEKQEKSIINSIPLYITNRFEKSLGDKIPVDFKTGETELENQEALKILLALKPGDIVESQVGFYYSNKSKSDGDFLTYNEAKSLNKEVSPKTLTIRLYDKDTKLGAIKNNQEEDIQDIFNNIESNPSLQNNILKSPLEVTYKWSGFIRSLANKDLSNNYKEVPFEDRAYINSPSEVVGNKDFIILTVNSEGELKLPNYNKTTLNKALSNLGLKYSSDLVGKFDTSNLRPGVMYTLINTPDGKIMPLASHGEYITPENAKYVVDEITKASKNKNYDIKELKQNISPFIYYDKSKGFYLESGKVKYKGENITLSKMKELIQDRNTYIPIDLSKSTNNKKLDILLKLNVPKASSIQFINPKVVLNLYPLKSKEVVNKESKEAETHVNEIVTTNDNIPTITNEEIKDDNINKEDLQDFENIPDELVSKYTQDLHSSPTLNPEDEIANAQDLKDILKKYNKNLKDVPDTVKKNISTYTIKELDKIIYCM